MLILAFDTTSSILSVALLQDDKLLAKNIVRESQRHSELLIPEIEKILHSQKIWYQDLDLIAVTNGPGSFTGSRIGLTAARTIKTATNLPLILVNSCEAIAFKYRDFSGKIFTALDATMDEFFCAEFFSQNGKITTTMEPCLVKAEDISMILPQDDFLICGSGKNLIRTTAKSSPQDDILEADLVGLVALEKFRNSESLENLDPLYLRSPRIEKRKK